ncbi:g5944 [Coccomyxa elongata]
MVTQHALIVAALPAVESVFSYEVETVIEAAEGESVNVMPIAGLKSSRWDPCRNKAQYLEQCMGQNDFNPAECQPQLADLKKCCKRYQGKSIHCGFDPAVDPPDKHDVPLPDPEIPVEFKPAAPATLGPGAKEAPTLKQQHNEGTAAKGDIYLSLETKVKHDDAKERAAQPDLAKAVSSAAAKLLHPGGAAQQQPAHTDPEERAAESAQHNSSHTGNPKAQGTGPQAEQVPPARAGHGGARSAEYGAAKEAQQGDERGNVGTEQCESESADDSQPHILDERMQVPFVPKGTRWYHIIEHMMEKKADKLAEDMKKGRVMDPQEQTRH